MLIVTMTLVPLDKFIQNRIYTEFRGGVLEVLSWDWVLGVPELGVGHWGCLGWGTGGAWGGALGVLGVGHWGCLGYPNQEQWQWSLRGRVGSCPNFEHNLCSCKQAVHVPS